VEIALNLALIAVFSSLGIGLAVVKADRVRSLLTGSIVLSFMLWWATEAFGQLLTGTATDVNTGPS
jgi:galactitol-specific phosphotransferase system IIC component